MLHFPLTVGALLLCSGSVAVAKAGAGVSGRFGAEKPEKLAVGASRPLAAQLEARLLRGNGSRKLSNRRIGEQHI